MATTKAKSKDFTEGPLFFRMLLFALPIVATGVLQILYNMADQMVVGQFSGDPNALGAVGSTSSFTHLIVNIAMGLSVGVGVVVAQAFGRRDERAVFRTVHTSFSVGLIVGVFLAALGVLVARPVLVLLGTKAEILDLAVLYVRIIFLGLPAGTLYNFGAAILRSVGDSRTPLIILALSGVLNVLLNLFFVIACGMSVEGVAIATILAQYVSAFTVWVILARRDDSVHFSLRNICLVRRCVCEILRIGVPSALQSALFSLSNMFLQSGVNTFPTTTVSGVTVGSSIEGITYTAMHSFYQAALTFTGQNHGAGKTDRIWRILLYGCIQVTVIGLVLGYVCILFAEPLGALFIDTSLPGADAVIVAAGERIRIVLSFYFLCGLQEILVGHLRGKGCSLVPMVSSLMFAMVFRVLWVFLVFPIPTFNSVTGLFLCYPISWVCVGICHLITALVLAHMEKKKRSASSLVAEKV